jgi:hypothetical protein
MRSICLALVVATAVALPLGGDHIALVSEESSPHDSFMRNQVDDFKSSLAEAQTGTHPDAVSQALSDNMDETMSESNTLADLEKDNEEIGQAVDEKEEEPDLGESKYDSSSYTSSYSSTTASSAGADAAAAKAKDEEEIEKLDKQEQAAKKLEEKNENMFDKMGSDLQAKADMKKQVKDVQDAADKALKVAGTDKDKDTTLGESKFDMKAFEAKYGKKSSTATTSSSSSYSTTSYSTKSYSTKSYSTPTSTSSKTTEADAGIDDKIAKLVAMAKKLKASEKTSEKNMDSVEKAYVKQKKTSDEMKKEMSDFKKKAKAASALADNDDPSEELGESSAQMDEEIENLQELQQSVTKKMDKDEVGSMVAKSNHAIQKFADSAMDVIKLIESA